MTHTQVYRKFFKIGDQDRYFCEHCQQPGNDIHHILGRGNYRNIIENLIGLCRNCHEAAHHLKKDMDFTIPDLIYIHREFIARNRPDYRFNKEALKKISNKILDI